MKKFGLAAGMTLIMVMTACTGTNTNQGNATGDTIETDIVETDDREDVNDTTATQSDSADYESQLNLLAGEYSTWNTEINNWQTNTNADIDVAESYKVAVTDLNRNGRLELICSSIQGTGMFSITFVFEVNESNSGVSRLYSTGRDDGVDIGGDFSEHNILNCFKKDEIYYYGVEDYTVTGWALTDECLYSYSFDNCIKPEEIGGYSLTAEDVDFKTINVSFKNKNKQRLESAEAFDQLINDYWKGCEKQPCVEMKWVDYPQEKDCYERLKASFDGYNEESDKTCDLLPDYKSKYGDAAEYTIAN